MPNDISISNEEDRSDINQLGILTVSLGQDDERRVLPSHLLSDDSWVRLVIELLDLENMNVTTNITQPQKDKADHLVKILQNQFDQHLVRRIKDEIKHTQWSMKFAYTNLAVSAACMVLSKNVKD